MYENTFILLFCILCFVLSFTLLRFHIIQPKRKKLKISVLSLSLSFSLSFSLSYTLAHGLILITNTNTKTSDFYNHQKGETKAISIKSHGFIISNNNNSHRRRWIQLTKPIGLSGRRSRCRCSTLSISVRETCAHELSRGREERGGL